MTLGAYRLEEHVGSGAFGSVYRAVLTEDRGDARAGESFAVKVLAGDVTPDLLRRFQREAELGRSIEHPSTVRVHEIFRGSALDRAFHCLAMEYVEGRTLRKVMDQLGALPENLLRALAVQIGSALGAVHRAGAIHRDVKPTNILITDDYRVKLTDFGIAHLERASAALTATGTFLGTFSYAAPEQLSAQAVTAAADLYSLGIVLYEAATGVQPFAGADLQETIGRHFVEVPAKVGELRPEISPLFEGVISQLLEKEPARRFASAQELLEVLQEGEASRWWKERARTLRPAGARRRARRISKKNLLPFAGRELELEEAVRLWRRSRGGAGRLLLIEGEAGIGKSRLVEELAARVESRNEVHHLLYGSQAPGSASGAGALAQALVEFIGEADLETGLRELVPEMAHLAPGIAALLTGLTSPADGAAVPWKVLRPFLLRLARKVSSSTPVLWIVEDLHFAPAEDRELLEALAHAAAELPMLLVVTCRQQLAPPELSRLAALDHSRKLILGRLPEVAERQILERVLGNDRHARRLACRIASRSDGNPLFLAELVRTARDATFVDTPHGWSQTVDVPASVRDLLRARLEGVDPADQALLNIGAVQGFHFDPEVLAGARETNSLEVLERLAEVALRRGIVRGTDRGFRFEHHLLQELLYEELPPVLRKTYHRRIAAALEKRLAETGDAAGSGHAAVELCEHYLKGGDGEAGARFALAALDHLAGRYRSAKLLELSALILEAVPEDHYALRCDVLLRHSECLFLIGRRDAAAAAARQALRLARAGDDLRREARARFAQGRTVADAGPEGYEILRDALRRAEAAGDPATMVRALGQLGLAALRDGRFADGLDYSERQRRRARALEDRASLAEAEHNTGVALMGLSRFEDAKRHLEEAVELCREIGLLDVQARAEGYLGSAWNWLGRYGRARPVYERAIEACRDLGLLEAELLTLGNLAWNCLFEGDLELAAGLHDEIVELARDSAFTYFTAYVKVLAAELARARDEPERERELWEEALARCEPGYGFYRLLQALHGIGRHCYQRGDRGTAREHFRKALALVEEHRMTVFEPLVRAYVAVLGDGDPSSVTVPDTMAAHLRAEAHLLLHRGGAGGGHLERAGAVLRHMSAHLEGRRLSAFWRNNPSARAYVAEGNAP